MAAKKPKSALNLQGLSFAARAKPHERDYSSDTSHLLPHKRKSVLDEVVHKKPPSDFKPVTRVRSEENVSQKKLTTSAFISIVLTLVFCIILFFMGIHKALILPLAVPFFAFFTAIVYSFLK